MARKKKADTPLAEINVSISDVSGEKPQKPKREGGGCRTNLLFGIIIVGFLMYIGSTNSANQKIQATQTAVALSDPTKEIIQATQAPSQSTTTISTATHTPQSVVIAMPTTAPTQAEMFFPTALPAQGTLETGYAQITGITSVDMVSVRGNIAYAEITHRAGVNRRTLATQMMQLALQTTANASLDFSVIFTDGQTCEDYAFDLGTDDWRVTSITCPSAPIVAFTPEEGLGVKIDPTTYYAGTGGANIRDCTKTSCAIVGKLASGGAIVTNYVVNGDSVDAGNAIWYRVQYNGVTGYVYSGVVTGVKPATSSGGSSAGGSTGGSGGSANGGQSGGTLQQAAPPAAPAFTCPSNCTEAKAMGLSAEQSAACGLDRDGDGVACYGD